jgi:integrase
MEAEIMNPVKDYIDELRLLGRSANTIRNTINVLKKFQGSCNGKDVLEVTEGEVKLFIQAMRDQPISDRSLSEYMRHVDRFYSFVIENKKYGLVDNPVKRLSKRLNNKRTQTKRPIKTTDEITKLIKNIHNPRDRAIVVLLAKTAIRNGELGALDIEDIDFDNATIRIDKHVADHNSNKIMKGRKNGNTSVIPMDDETIRVLKFHLMTRPAVKLKDKPEDGNALFKSIKGYRLYPKDITRIVKEWAIRTGTCLNTIDTDKKIVPHFFRAWCTYTLQLNGCNPVVIDAIRGDVASTIRAFYVNQVLPFEVIKKEYLRTVPKFGI